MGIQVGHPPQALSVVQQTAGYYACAPGGNNNSNFNGALVTFNIDTNFGTTIPLTDVHRAFCSAEVDVINLLGGGANPNFTVGLDLYILLSGGGTVYAGSAQTIYFAAAVNPITAWTDDEYRVGGATVIGSTAIASGYRVVCGLNPNPGLQGNFAVVISDLIALRGDPEDIS